MRRVLLLLPLLAALALAPAAAHAAGPWVAQYLVAVDGGQQTTSWSINHPDRGACDVSQVGSGTETATFQAAAGSPLFAAGSGAGAPTLGPASDVLLPAFVDREAQVAYGADDGDDSPGFCTAPPPSAPASPDCGTKAAQGFIDVTPTSGLGLDIQPGPSQVNGPGSPYTACAIYGVAFPTLVEPSFALSAASFGPAAPASFVADGKASRPVTDPDTSGQSSIDLQLRFTRALLTGSTRPGPGAGSLAVARDGTLLLPLRCPKGGPACAGTIALGTGQLGIAIEAALRAASPFPAPVTSTEPTIASNAFKLKPGRRGSVRLRLLSGKPSSVRKFGRIDLDLVETAKKGSRSVRFIIGTTRVRPK
jgi:hypothetical protein